MKASIRAAVLFFGTILMVVAAVLFGESMTGQRDFGPFASLVFGSAGLGLFMIGLFMPNAGLIRPVPDAVMDVDTTGLDIGANLDGMDDGHH